MKNIILKALNIRRGEEKAIFLLLSYSFFMGLTIAFFLTSATSLFIISFESDMLPLAYIGGGLMSYFVWLGYARAKRSFSFPKVIIMGIIALLVSVFLFIAGTNIFKNIWIFFVMFVWIRVFIFISSVGFWGLAGRIFDLRQGKRIFSLISTGEVISKIVGFFSIPFVLRKIETPDLLYISFVGLIICVLMMAYMLKHIDKPPSEPQIQKAKLKENWIKLFFSNKYLRYLVILGVIPMFGICFADFSFMHQMKVEFFDQNVISSFISMFFGVAAIIELILKSFVSGRVLSKFGLKTALLILPVIILISVFLSISSGILYGTAGLFFSFVAFTKITDRVARSSIYDPSFQVLYQPLPKTDRLSSQSMVEGMAKGLGFALAGGLIWVFTQLKFLSLIHINAIFFLILLLWIKMCIDMYSEYKGKLKSILASKNKNFSEIVDKTNLIKLSKIARSDPKVNVNLLLNVMNSTEPKNILPFFQRILSGSSENTQNKLLENINNSQIISACSILDNQIKLNPNNKNLEFLKSTKNALLDSKKINIYSLAQLSKSALTEDRLLAAQLLAYSDRYNAFKILIDLLHDKNPKIIKTALISSAHTKRPQLWPYILRNLFIPQYSASAITAIKIIGDPILTELDNYFEKDTTLKNIRLNIIGIYAGIKSELSLKLLKSRLHYPDGDIRHQILKGIVKTEFHANSNEAIGIKKQMQEEMAMIVWIMACLFDLKNGNEMQLLHEALEFELNQKRENVFLLLSMIYDSKTIQYISESFQEGTHESKVFATEILDLTVSTEIKQLFLPLLEAESIEESIRLYEGEFPQQKLNIFNRLKDIVNKDYTKLNRWTKACALICLENFKGNEHILLSNVINPDPLLMEISFNSLHNKKSEQIEAKLNKLRNFKNYQYNPATILNRQSIDHLLLFDKVNLLKKSPIFSSIHHSDISLMIESAGEIILYENEIFELEEYSHETLLFVLKGSPTILVNGIEFKSLAEHETYWALTQHGEDEIFIKSENTCVILVLNTNLLFDIMAENSDYTEEIIEILSKRA